MSQGLSPWRCRPAAGDDAQHRCADRPAGCQAAVPMLRWTHNRHRFLRTPVQTTRAAARHHVDRDHHVMVRHGSSSSSRAAHALPAMMTLAPPTPPPALASISYSGSGRQPRRTQALEAVCLPANGHPHDHRARLTTGQNPRTRRPPPGARGFLHWSISYTCRRPISFTRADGPVAPQRSLRRSSFSFASKSYIGISSS